MVRLNDLIHVHENSLSASTCKALINFFERNKNTQEEIDNDGCPNFTQINLTKNKNLDLSISKIHDQIIKKVLHYKKEYYNFIDERVFPVENSFEEFRIKRYNTGGDQRFDTHVDVRDHASSRRFLSFFWYLNDVDDGGETVFIDLKIKPQQGKLVVFPPLWMFPHKANPPISGSKYLLSTYLHYK